MQKAFSQYPMGGEGAEILRDAQGVYELDRGESIELDELLEKARAIVDAAEHRLKGKPPAPSSQGAS
jgi:hypothetical protein